MYSKSLTQSLDRILYLCLMVTLLTSLVLSTVSPAVRAATPGLPFTEDFSDTNLRDANQTNANWSTEEQALILAWRQKQFGAYGPGLNGSDITADAHWTHCVALGDVDGDGDLDLVAGNQNQANRLYLNNGTADPWNGVAGSDITSDAHSTQSVALGDVDGDGDLDLIVGNFGANRLYLNNGTADPFNGVSGSDITADAHSTLSVALGDVDGDGDLDLVAGNYNQANRLYLNNGTADPWNGVVGSDITADAHDTRSVALGDVDGDGDLDLVAGNTGSVNRLYLNNGTADPFNGVSGSDIASDAHSTKSVTLGDVDGDGDLDLVVGNFGANRLYLNNGTADPFNGVSGSDIASDAHSTKSVALGDVDGDGDLDLVAGNHNQANRLYLNNGTADPWNGVVGSDITSDAHYTWSVALGDVDGDGDLDLVVGNYNQANRLYLNNGTADPWNGVVGSDITSDAHNTRSMALGDVDGDGDLDLVAGNFGANRLYLNNSTADPFNGVSGSDITSDVRDTYAVALGDVDGDGDLDLVAGNWGQANRLYLNNGTASPWNGVSGSDITADAHWTDSVALGDVDGDGDLDLVAGNFGANRLYLNNGTADPFNGVSGSDITSDAHNTRPMALGDVDGDGDLDLVTGNYEANRLYLNNGTANPWNGVSGSDITSDAHNTHSVALGDVDGDGDLDLVAGNNFDPNRLYLNNGTADPWNGVAGLDITSDAHRTFSVALGDMDGDGDLDLVAGNWWDQANRLYLNNGTANPWNGVVGSDITSDAHWTDSVTLGDVDGDGDLDLVVGNQNQANRLYLNNGFPSPTTGWAGSDITSDAHNTRSVALGDVDSDGDPDLVAGNYWYEANRLYLNNGTADPFNGVSGSDITSDAHKTWSVALGDVDSDGDLDLIMGNTGANRLYLNNGTADPFNSVSGSDITSDAHNTRSVALGDMDGDGDLDLVTGNYEANRLYLNNGTADPFNGVSGSDITSDAHNTISVALGDVDGDGDLDLVAGSYWYEANRLYLNNGTADPFNGVSGSDITSDAHETRSVALGDVDGDGDLDLVVGNFGANRLYLNNGTDDPFNGVSGSDITSDAHSTHSVALGDVDDDGDLDLIVGNYSDPNRLYLNNGTADPWNDVTGLDITSDAHHTNSSVVLGDVDGDGDLDLVTGNEISTPNRLYRRVLYHTAHGRATSLEVDTESGNIANATLTSSASLPRNTRVDYWLSNNGGAYWYLVRLGVNFVFPTSGSDLRWRAELHSLSPVKTPRVSQINITTCGGVLDHFAFALISSPQTAGQAFQVTITAQDENDNTVTSYTGPASLSDTTGTISPTTAGNFSAGVWTGHVMIMQAQSGVTITAQDGSASGTSNSFDVEATGPESNKVYLPLVTNWYCACGPDDYEPNSPCEKAKSLTLPANVTSYISCCDVAFGKNGEGGKGYDYFSFHISATSNVTIVLDNPTGKDYDLYLYRHSDCENWIAKSDGYSDVETISISLSSGTYYALVFSPYAHYSASPYSLRVTYD